MIFVRDLTSFRLHHPHRYRIAHTRDTGNPLALVIVQLEFGLVACFSGQPERGVRMLAAALTLLNQRGIKFSSAEGDPFMMVYKQVLEMARSQLGPAAFQAAWAEGQQMTMEQAITLATESEIEDSPLPKDGLSPTSD